jgi:hypothetical protein
MFVNGDWAVRTGWVPLRDAAVCFHYQQVLIHKGFMTYVSKRWCSCFISIKPLECYVTDLHGQVAYKMASVSNLPVLPFQGHIISRLQLYVSIQKIMFWTALFGLLAVYVVRFGFGFFRQRSLARQTGLPYVLFPFSEQSVIYLSLFETRWVPYVVNRWFPRELADYIHGSVFKYRWTVKDRLCKKYGGVYLFATPATLICNISDTSDVSQVCMTRHSFPKPVQQYGR